MLKKTFLDSRSNICAFGEKFRYDLWKNIINGCDLNKIDQYKIAIVDIRQFNVLWPILHSYDDYSISRLFSNVDTISREIKEYFRGHDNKILILDSRENINPDKHLKIMLDIMKSVIGLDTHQIIFVNPNHTRYKSCRQITSLIGMVDDIEDGVSPCKKSTHHFVLLARTPRTLRTMLIVDLISKELLPKGKLSCGVNPLYSKTKWKDILIPKKYHDLFPMVLDENEVSQDKQADYSHDNIRKAAVHVICETSQDEDMIDTVWFDLSIEEKTTKAFKLCQFPIWLAVPGTVNLVKKMGYDVFDDIIDHAYDNELDPKKRVNMISEQIKKFTEMSLYSINKLRSEHWERLMYNKRKIEILEADPTSHISTQLSDLL